VLRVRIMVDVLMTEPTRARLASALPDQPITHLRIEDAEVPLVLTGRAVSASGAGEEDVPHVG
jgi:hypothetical protein